MGAFDGLGIKGGVPDLLENNRQYIKNQSAFVLSDNFTKKQFTDLVVDCENKGYSTVWIPSKSGKIGICTWYARALLENNIIS